VASHFNFINNNIHIYLYALALSILIKMPGIILRSKLGCISLRDLYGGLCAYVSYLVRDLRPKTNSKQNRVSMGVIKYT